MSEIKRMVSKVVDALQSPQAKRLGRTKTVCKDVLLSIPAFRNGTAKKMIEEVVDKGEDYLQMAQYTLYNIYFGMNKKVDPTSKLFLELVKYLTRMLNDYSEAEIKGCALAALANLGPYAVRFAMNSRHPDPVLSALASPNTFLRECAQEALDNIPMDQPEGKPILASKELATVRGQFMRDVPAYQESVHYVLFEDGDKEIPDLKKKVEGKIVDSEIVKDDEDGRVEKQTIIIPRQ